MSQWTGLHKYWVYVLCFCTMKPGILLLSPPDFEAGRIRWGGLQDHLGCRLPLVSGAPAPPQWFLWTSRETLPALCSVDGHNVRYCLVMLNVIKRSERFCLIFMWTRGSVAQDERGTQMASPTSDTEMVIDTEDLTKGLEEPSERPEEEQSEKALLHSNLEEQHHLLCILKQKSRGCTQTRHRGVEQLSMELEKLRTDDTVKMKTQSQRIQQLEDHFMHLANNHKKWSSSRTNTRSGTQLWEENKRLPPENKALFSQTVREREDEVLQLTAQTRKLLQHLDFLQEKCAYESPEPRSKKRSC